MTASALVRSTEFPKVASINYSNLPARVFDLPDSVAPRLRGLRGRQSSTHPRRYLPSYLCFFFAFSGGGFRGFGTVATLDPTISILAPTISIHRPTISIAGTHQHFSLFFCLCTLFRYNTQQNKKSRSHQKTRPAWSTLTRNRPETDLPASLRREILFNLSWPDTHLEPETVLQQTSSPPQFETARKIIPKSASPKYSS